MADATAAAAVSPELQQSAQNRVSGSLAFGSLAQGTSRNGQQASGQTNETGAALRGQTRQPFEPLRLLRPATWLACCYCGSVEDDS